jgi:hypothetical protein
MMLAFLLTLAGAVSPAAPPCAACIHWLASPEVARRLLDSGERLDGVDLVMAPEPPPELAASLADRGAAVGLLVTALDRPVPSLAAGRLVVPVDEHAIAGRELAFRLKRFVTAVRAQHPETRVGVMAPSETLERMARTGLSAYSDFVVATDGGGGPEAWVRLDASAAATVETVLAATAAAGRHLLIDLPAGSEAVAIAAGRLHEWLPEGLGPLPSVSVACAGCATAVYLDPRTLQAVALVRGPGPIRGLSITPTPSAVQARSLTTGAGATLGETDGPLALRIEGWAGDVARFASGVDVEAERPLTVEEVVARHQAAAAAQRRQVRSLVSTGSTVVTFQVPGLSAPMTIAAETILWEGGGRRAVEYRSLRLNGLELVGARRAPLPIVEPQRWAAPPLAIELDDAYRYRLEARERVAGRDCYVVRFTPRLRGRALPGGRAWIERGGFALVRLETEQTGLRGAIVSSRERDDFAPVDVDGRTAWLLSRSDVRQLYEGAGHRTPVHRLVALEAHEPNPSEFATRLAEAEASPSVMLEETSSGVRYLQRDGGASSPRRIAGGKASRVSAVALGFLVDPNITRRLPFAGLSHSDLDFLGTGAQVNVFLAGAFARAAWSAPSFGGWRLEGSAFTSLVTYNDRSFRAGLERYEENLRQRPTRASLELARPVGAQWRLRAAYELSHTSLSRSDLTAADFVVPASPTAHALRLQLDTQRGPWTAAGWWSPAWRQRWRSWGARSGADYDPRARSYRRWGVTAARTFAASPRGVARLEASWLGGRRLDRFSRYGFEGFEGRLRGYPGASIRFDRAAVLRGSATRELARGIRAEAYFDTALVLDPGLGPRLRGYSGAGAGLQAALPRRALLSLEWGHGFQGRGPGGQRGTNSYQLTVFKPI